jgi:hypothetical protein
VHSLLALPEWTYLSFLTVTQITSPESIGSARFFSKPQFSAQSKGRPSRGARSWTARAQNCRCSDIWIWRGLPMVCVTMPRPDGHA